MFTRLGPNISFQSQLPLHSHPHTQYSTSRKHVFLCNKTTLYLLSILEVSGAFTYIFSFNKRIHFKIGIIISVFKSCLVICPRYLSYQRVSRAQTQVCFSMLFILSFAAFLKTPYTFLTLIHIHSSSILESSFHFYLLNTTHALDRSKMGL